MTGRTIGRHGLAIWPPVLVWLAGSAVVLITAKAAGYAPFAPENWTHWDSGLYLSQAREGVTLYRCARDSPFTGWCGNAGWFPGYPLLIRGLMPFGLSAETAGLVLAWTFAAATPLALWNTFLERRVAWPTFAALAYAAVAPGVAFRYGIYPLSMLSFFTILSLWFLARRRLIGAGIAGALAVTAYPAGIVLIPVGACWLLATGRGAPLRERIRGAALCSAVTALGLLLVAGLDWEQTGHPNAYLLVQGHYGHRVREPFAELHAASYVVLRDGDAFSFGNAHYSQTFLVATVLGLGLVALLLRRATVCGGVWLLAVWAIATWLFVSLPTHVSSYREDAVLLPVAPLLAWLPRWLAAVAVAAAIALAVPMTVLYLRGELA